MVATTQLARPGMAALLAVPLAFAVSYLSSFIFQTPDYQSGCDAFCPGWRGYPVATHLGDGFDSYDFYPVGFVLNGAFYYAVIVVASAILVWLANYLRWKERSLRWRLGFIALFVVLPLALAPA